MSCRFLVPVIALFILTGPVCVRALTVTEDKKPAKASPAIVKKDMNTKNDIVRSDDIYIAENMLYVKTLSVNELIYVYTASGLCIDKFVKDTELVVKNASAYPAGVLIVTNGKDLTVKVVK